VFTISVDTQQYDKHIELLQARIMQLTETNDEIRRDNELLKRDNHENGYWVDNQMELMDRCNDLAGIAYKYELEIKELKA